MHPSVQRLLCGEDIGRGRALAGRRERAGGDILRVRALCDAEALVQTPPHPQTIRPARRSGEVSDHFIVRAPGTQETPDALFDRQRGVRQIRQNHPTAILQIDPFREAICGDEDANLVVRFASFLLLSDRGEPRQKLLVADLSDARRDRAFACKQPDLCGAPQRVTQALEETTRGIHEPGEDQELLLL